MTEAVITVPAYFDDTQRQATKDAGPDRRPRREADHQRADRVARSPTASTRRRTRRSPSTTSAAARSTSRSSSSATASSRCKSTNGDTHLGGDDFDQRVIDWLLAEFKKEPGDRPPQGPEALQRLKEAAEKAKIELSTTTQTEINLPYITADQTGPKHLVVSLTRAKLEDLVADLIDKTRARSSRRSRTPG